MQPDYIDPALGITLAVILSVVYIVTKVIQDRRARKRNQL